jgi:hypothetical protein
MFLSPERGDMVLDDHDERCRPYGAQPWNGPKLIDYIFTTELSTPPNARNWDAL